MSQARRTRRKPFKKAPKKRVRSSFPWGLCFIVLVSGFALGAFAAGYFYGYGPLGKGLKNYDLTMAEKVEKIGDQQQDAPVRTQKEFQFYEMLEGKRDLILPDDFSIEQTAVDRAKYYYIMQIATLSSKSAADSLRAKLALQGYETVVQEKNGKYRLKMGPYEDKRTLKNARNRIKNTGLGLSPIAIQYKKE
jgi:cell division protein FtsN